MSRIFISHSSRDNDAALKLRNWLIENGWGDLFLDLDPGRGIAASEKWRDALRDAVNRCEAVLCLISRNWLASSECRAEFAFAKYLGKRIFPILIEALPWADIPAELQAEQFVNLAADERVYDRLQNGLIRARIDPGTFAVPLRRKLPPDGDGPYPGFAPLTEDDAAIFFGREAHIVRGLDRLRLLREQGIARLLVVLGASGSGKSSFVRAGLVPRLRRDDRFLLLPVIRPERAVLTGDFGLGKALAAALANADLASASIAGLPRLRGVIERRLLADSGSLATFAVALAEAAHKARPAPEHGSDTAAPTVLLFVDQGEELFSADGAAEAASFLQALAAALQSKAPFLAVIALRSDSYPRLQAEKLLLSAAKDALDLPPMEEGNYRTIVEGPARLVGLDIAPELIAELLRDMGGTQADALPLLAFMLERLFLERGQARRLTAEHYRALGGIGGVIGAAMKRVFASAREDRRLPGDEAVLTGLLRSVFVPHLARLNEAGEFVRRVAAVDEIPEKARSLVDHLVRHRLLIRDRRKRAGAAASGAGSGARGTVESADIDVVEVAHEALLREWEALARWLAEEREFLVWRGQFESDRRLWEAEPEDKRDQALLAGRKLAIAQDWAARRASDLPTADVAFIARSASVAERQRQRVRRVRAAVMAALALLAVGAGVGAYVVNDLRVESEHRRQAALRAQSLYLADLSLREINLGDAVTGALLALEALPRQWPKNERPYVVPAEIALATAIYAQKERSILRGHGSVARTVAFSPDGTRMVAAYYDRTIRILDVMTGAATAVLSGHEGAVHSAAFSPDGTRVVSASFDKTVRIWDAKTGAALAELRGHEDAVWSVAFSPDGRRIVSASWDGTVRLWDSQTGDALAVLRGHQGAVWSAAFGPDGTRIVSASQDRTVRLWDARTGATLAVWRGHEGRVFSAAFSPDGTRIVSASGDGTVRFWGVNTGAVMAVLRGHEGQVFFAAFSVDGTRIVSASGDKTVRLWDVKAGAALAVLRGHEDIVFSAAFGPDGTRIASASWDGTVRLWDAQTGAALVELRGHEGNVGFAAFGPDGTRIVSASEDRTVRLWDARTGATLAVLRGHDGQVYSAAFSPDGTRIVSASLDKTVRLWDARTGAALAVLRGHESIVWYAAFSADGMRIVSASYDKTVRIFDEKTGAELAVLRGHDGQVYSAAFSPDGTRIVSASSDRSVRLWDARTGAALAVLRGHEDVVWSVAFGPDGTRIVSASWDRTARLWDVRTGAELAVLRGHEDNVVSAAFSPDGTRIVSASREGTVRLWDAKTAAALAVLRGNSGPANSAIFNPDGTRIVSASADRTIRIWPVLPTGKALIDHARKVLPRELAKEQRVKYHLDPQ